MKDLELDKRQGTRRYMAPEILDFTIKKNDFEALKRSDIYSLSLIMWELARCTDLSGKNFGRMVPISIRVNLVIYFIAFVTKEYAKDMTCHMEQMSATIPALTKCER